MAMFMVAEADHYLVRTGWGISDVSISRKAWRFIGQKAFFIDMTPNIYSLSLQAMTLEKLEFTMPAVFIIGPRDGKDPKDGKSFVLKYAKTVAQANDKKGNLTALVRGVVEGESRVVAATMRMEDIFNSREDFRNKIMKGVQHELDEFGLYIYNANIKQLSDTPGSEYFQYIRQKTHEGAVNQAKIEVAKAKYAGDVGEKTQQASTRKEVSLLEADTVVLENRNKNLIVASESELQIKKADYDKKVKVAHLEAEKGADMRRAEMQKDVEKLRLLEETARKKADVLSLKRALNQAAKDKADAQAYVRQRKADAALFTREKEGEGMLAIATAQADGLKSLISAMNGEHGAVLQYLMIERGLFSDIAKCSSDAIRGLNPQIHVWTTDGNGNGNGGQNQFQNLLQSLPPLLSTIQDQTGIQPPTWLAQMGPSASPESAGFRTVGNENRTVDPRRSTATDVTPYIIDTGTGSALPSRTADLSRRLRPGS